MCNTVVALVWLMVFVLLLWRTYFITAAARAWTGLVIRIVMFCFQTLASTFLSVLGFLGDNSRCRLSPFFDIWCLEGWGFRAQANLNNYQWIAEWVQLSTSVEHIFVFCKLVAMPALLYSTCWTIQMWEKLFYTWLAKWQISVWRLRLLQGSHNSLPGPVQTCTTIRLVPCIRNACPSHWCALKGVLKACKMCAAGLLLGQHSFWRCDLPCSPLIDLACFPQSSCKSFECGLNNMMGVLTSKLPYVQGHSACIHHRLEKMLYKLCVIGTDMTRRNL